MRLCALALCALAVGLGGCEPVPPAVACDGLSLVVGEKRTTAEGACSFPEAFVFNVAHTLKAVDGETPASVYTQIPVQLSRLGGVITLCEGLSCSPTEAELALRTDTLGMVRYSVRVDVLALGIPGAGGSTSVKADVVRETYGPGNSCPINLQLDLQCALTNP
jgi:hypothetical protein